MGKGLLVFLLGVIFSLNSFASGKFLVEPSKEISRPDQEVNMKVGLSIYQKVAGPLHLVSFTGFGQGVDSGDMKYVAQKLGVAFHVGSNLQLEAGGTVSKDTDAKYDFTQQTVYGKASVQLW